MSSFTEKQLDKIFAEALSRDDFRAWVLSHTKFAGRQTEPVLVRSDNPWARSKITGRDSETDILLVARDCQTGDVFAVHFENKKRGGSFTHLQPETYHERARQWIGLPKYGRYTDFECVLIAPRLFQSANAERASIFDRYVAHEDIAALLPEFGAD